MRLLYSFILFLSTNIIFCQNSHGIQQITEDVFEGYTLFSIHEKVYLIDNCGRLVNEWTSNYLPGNSVYLLPNGNILRAGRVQNIDSQINFGGRGGIAEIFDWEGNLIWSYTYIGDDFRQHHDIFPMPNGNILILAATVISNSDAIAAGRDPSKLEEGTLFNEQIIEIEPVGSNDGHIVWEWNIMDHLVQDYDPTKANFGIIEDNPGRLDINFLNDLDSGSNWLHINSIQFDEERNQIVINSRRLCEFWIIDHSTTTIEAASNSGGIYENGGDFLYRWGNPLAYKKGTVNDRKLFGQHMPYIIPSGLPNENKIILFNNGLGRIPLFSQVDIIEPPVTLPGFYDYDINLGFGPNNTSFTYPEIIPTNNSEFFSTSVSSAQQLPNGNILVCKGVGAQFFEIDSNGNIVWEYLLPINQNNGLPFPENTPSSVGSFTFRALKYDENYEAFDGRDLTPSNPLEINPNINFCSNTLDVTELHEMKMSLYPNPTNAELNIQFIGTIDLVEIYNLSGFKVKEVQSNYVNLSDLSNGMYIMNIYAAGKRVIKKIIKQ